MRDAFVRNHPALLVLGRDGVHLNQRFARNPRYRYLLFVVRACGIPLGYLALKEFEDPVTGDSCGDIVDLLWGNEEPSLVRNMLRFALASFHERGIERAVVWLPDNTILRDIGAQCGFVPTDVKRFFGCRILDDRYAWLADGRRWFLTMSDSEVY